MTLDPIGPAEAQSIARARSAEPDETLDHEVHGPYLRKWRVARSPDGSARLVHQFLRSDADDEFHDHPWDNETFVVEGGYWEVTPSGRRWLGPGDRVRRRAEDLHRVELAPGILPVTIFDHGPKRREWGFVAADGAATASETFLEDSGSYRR